MNTDIQTVYDCIHRFNETVPKLSEKLKAMIEDKGTFYDYIEEELEPKIFIHMGMDGYIWLRSEINAPVMQEFGADIHDEHSYIRLLISYLAFKFDI